MSTANDYVALGMERVNHSNCWNFQQFAVPSVDNAVWKRAHRKLRTGLNSQYFIKHMNSFFSYYHHFFFVFRSENSFEIISFVFFMRSFIFSARLVFPGRFCSILYAQLCFFFIFIKIKEEGARKEYNEKKIRYERKTTTGRKNKYH